jgi:hypothetical protein
MREIACAITVAVPEEPAGPAPWLQMTVLADGAQQWQRRLPAQNPGEFDGLVDRGMVGNAVEEEELVGAETQHGLDLGALVASAGAAGDQPVEGGALAKDAGGEFTGEATVFGREGPVAGVGVQAMLEEVAGLLGPEEGLAGDLP